MKGEHFTASWKCEIVSAKFSAHSAPQLMVEWKEKYSKKCIQGAPKFIYTSLRNPTFEAVGFGGTLEKSLGFEGVI